jgi:hypothetical protein
MKLILAALVLLGLPGYYLVRRLLKKNIKKKRRMVLRLAFDRLVEQARLSIQHSELLKGRIIALDRKNKRLVLIDHNQEEKQEECIPLLWIQSCRVIEIKYGADAATRKIVLELKHKWNNKVSHFCFYDNAYDSISKLPTLTKSAKFWKHRIDLHKYPGSINLELEYV